MGARFEIRLELGHGVASVHRREFKDRPKE
jgi:hypothetical protein